MTTGDLVLYWPKWHPTIRSEPEGFATLIQFDNDECKRSKGNVTPPYPKWEILFHGRLLWVRSWQVMEVSDENRKSC
jgi:hypothetical protein